mmetsp:Transcript_4775/g.8186  ORF Transcript_4775/g.8186 Transcript_4775/m.8186 type:complete len:448 (+) Transcript_4775:45-1388(+)
MENEYELLNQKAKKPEEIERWCTKEDMSEVKRCVHLMKKGYEVQKISVINNIDRYMNEPGANEELFSLIIDSMMDWDDKMQKECANSFIKPLESNKIDKRNKEKVAKAAVQITTDEDNTENEELVEAWIKVLEAVAGKLCMQFVSESVIKQIKDLPSLKNPFQRRIRGNKLVFGVAKSVGEEGFDKDPHLMKVVMGICSDNNYKIRRDGVIFLKEYLKANRSNIINSPRFRDIYLPTLVDFLNDEDMHIQIDAIEAVNEIMDQLSVEELERDLLPCFLQFLDIENQSQIQIILRVASVFGELVNKISHFGLHLTYKREIIQFFKEICEHEDDDVRHMAAYNLPCMNLLYKPLEKELEISFSEIYLRFSEDERWKIKECVSQSLHEAFKLAEEEEDTSSLRRCFLGFILDNSRQIQQIMNKNLATIVARYGNRHTVETFKGRTPYVDS